jgi:hypothetical protein
MKLRGLGLTALLVFSGVTVGAMPAFAPTTPLTVRNNSTKHADLEVYQKPPELAIQPKEAPKPAKPAPKPVKNP